MPLSKRILPHGKKSILKNVSGSNVTGLSLVDAELRLAQSNNQPTRTVDLSSIGGGGSPGGQNTYIQYNNAGNFGGVAAMAYDSTDEKLVLTSSVAGKFSLKLKNNNNSSVVNGLLIADDADGSRLAITHSNVDNENNIWGYENIPMKFATNNTERMRIQGGGNVGIGTTGPGKKLHVQGSIAVSGAEVTGDSGYGHSFYQYNQSGAQTLRLYSDSRGVSGGKRQFINVSGRLTMEATENMGIGPSTSGEYLHLYSGDTAHMYLDAGDSFLFRDTDDSSAVRMRLYTATGKLLLNDSSAATKIQLQPSGDSYITNNLGIGTTSPEALLHVEGTSDLPIMILSGSGDTSFHYKTTGSGDLSFQYHVQQGRAADVATINGNTGTEMTTMRNKVIDANNSYTFFRTRDAGSLVTPMILSGSKVGIGTTSPSDIFHVYGSATDSMQYKTDLGDGFDGIQLIGGNPSLKLDGGGSTFITSAISTGLAVFDQTNGAYRMIIENGGNVGIGTTGPGEKLQVAGNIRIDDGTSDNRLIFNNHSTVFTSDSNDSSMQMRSYGGSSYNYPIKWVGASGTSNSNHISFLDDFVMISGSKVGIGTITPTGQLHVAASGATSKIVLESRSATENYSTGLSMAVGTARAVRFSEHGSNATYGGYSWEIGSADVGGTEIMRLTSQGNLGIGSTNPSYPLHVVQNSGDTYGMYLFNNGSKGIYFGDTNNDGTGYGKIGGVGGSLFLGSTQVYTSFIPTSDSSATLGQSNRRWSYSFFRYGQFGYSSGDDENSGSGGYVLGVSGNADRHPFMVKAYGDEGVPSLIVTSGSNVGIGTATPLYPLQVMGEIALGVAGNAYTGDRIKGATGKVQIIANGGTQATFDGTGLGIGTTGPNAKLDVLGSAKFGSSSYTTISDNEYDVSSGDFLLDVADDITLDAAGGDVKFSKAGGNKFSVYMDTNDNVWLQAKGTDKDLNITGVDNDTGQVTALSFDMSEAGLATFNTTPVVGTMTSSDNSTKAASTAYVTTAVAAAGGTPGGANKEIQFNNSSAFGGSKLLYETTGTNNAKVATTGSLYLYAGDNFHINSADAILLEPDEADQSGGDIKIYDYRGGTQYVTFKGSTQRVGIGTTAPDYPLHVNTTSTSFAAKFENDSTNGYVMQLAASDSTLNFQTDHIIPSLNMHLGDDNVNFYMRTAGYKFGVGTSSPKTSMSLVGALSIEERADHETTNAGWGQLWVKNDTPNKLYYTDDAGTDFDLTAGGGGGIGGSIANTQIAYGNGTDIAGNAGLTYTSAGGIDLVQGADEAGIVISGYDDKSSDWLKLHVKSDGIARLRAATSLQNHAAESIYLSAGEHLYLDNGTRGTYSTIFRDGTGEYARFKNARLGIGTTSPATKLDVVGSITAGTNSRMTIDDNKVKVNGDDLYISGSHDIYLDANGANIYLSDGGDKFGALNNNNAYWDFDAKSHAHYLRFITSGGLTYWGDGTDNQTIYVRSTGGIGTNDIKLAANNTSWFNGGNVGIGTNAPAAKLHVDGDIRIDNGHTLDFDARGYIDVNVDGATGEDEFFFRRRGSSNEVKLDMSTAGAPKLGIGTTAPAFPLVVSGTQYDMAKIISSHSAGSCLYLDADATGGSNWHLQSTADGAGSGGGKLDFVEDGTSRMIIKGGGNVGIGTTSPNNKLSVQGVGATSQIGVSSDGSNWSNIYNDGSDNLIINPVNDFIVTGSDDIKLQAGDDFEIFCDDLSISNGSSNYVYFDGGNQRVGIGTTNPSTKFHVSGTNIVSRFQDTTGVAFTDIKRIGVEDTYAAVLAGNAGQALGTTDDAYTDIWTNKSRYIAFRHATGSTTDGATTYMSGSRLSSEYLRFKTTGNNYSKGAVIEGPNELYVRTAGKDLSLDSGNNFTVHYDKEYAIYNDTGNPVFHIRSGSSAAIEFEGDGDMRFKSAGTSTKMSILTDGKVGIGTTTPSNTLEVAGVIRGTNYIWQKQDGTPGILLGNGGDADIYYDGSNMFFNAARTGTGKEIHVTDIHASGASFQNSMGESAYIRAVHAGFESNAILQQAPNIQYVKAEVTSAPGVGAIPTELPLAESGKEGLEITVMQRWDADPEGALTVQKQTGSSDVIYEGGSNSASATVSIAAYRGANKTFVVAAVGVWVVKD